MEHALAGEIDKSRPRPTELPLRLCQPGEGEVRPVVSTSGAARCLACLVRAGAGAGKMGTVFL